MAVRIPFMRINSIFMLLNFKFCEWEFISLIASLVTCVAFFLAKFLSLN